MLDRFRQGDHADADPHSSILGHGSKNSLSMYLLFWNTKALVYALQTSDSNRVPYACDEQLEELSTVLDKVWQANKIIVMIHYY